MKECNEVLHGCTDPCPSLSSTASRVLTSACCQIILLCLSELSSWKVSACDIEAHQVIVRLRPGILIPLMIWIVLRHFRTVALCVLTMMYVASCTICMHVPCNALPQGKSRSRSRQSKHKFVPFALAHYDRSPPSANRKHDHYNIFHNNTTILAFR